jgi:hypothetical protein
LKSSKSSISSHYFPQIKTYFFLHFFIRFRVSLLSNLIRHKRPKVIDLLLKQKNVFLSYI